MTDEPLKPDEHVDEQEQREANDPNVGDGTPDTAPWRDVEVPWLRRQPLVALIVATLAPTLAAFVTELAGDTEPATAVLLGGVASAITAGGLIAWRHVTPTARPRLDEDTPLTP